MNNLPKSSSAKIRIKQKKLFISIVVGLLAIVIVLVFFIDEDPQKPNVQITHKADVDVISQAMNPEAIRLSNLENMNDTLNERMEDLEAILANAAHEKAIFAMEKEELAHKTLLLQTKIETLEKENQERPSAPAPSSLKKGNFTSWERTGKKEEKHVAFEIPAGTVLKALLVSGADCSVAVHKPTGPNMVLLRPLDNGKLPRNVRVPLKGSILIGNAIGDLSSERVYIRGERLTLVNRDGSFVETEVSAYISGEDGKEGMRGVVVDRSGQNIARASFSAFLEGIGQTVEAMLSRQNAAQIDKDKILSFDLLRKSSFHSGATALNKLSEYYIKRAEQLQPAIQIMSGRVVDIVFTKTVKIGEKDIKKSLEVARAARRGNSNYE